MDGDRWALIARIYDSASGLPPLEQAAVLERMCAGDELLRREVESLLSQDVSHDGPLERAAVHVASARPLPTAIGHYGIRRLIGEGGMGAVYEATQEHPHRVVALKVIKSILASPSVLRRFDREAEALGRLEHPGIARIYEAGTAESAWGAQPYFAMELIRGPSLLEYARQRQLDVPARLALMMKICDAVDYAHHCGIVHRDLKPANILVDQDGQPKVLDFGVARVLDRESPTTEETQLGDLVGTLAYMSPEQVMAEPAAVDARSDVYSLGVVLYELLAGTLPYRIDGGIAEAMRILRECDPTSLGSINRGYRGDIEIIVDKALEKEPARRYQSAGALADDLRRHLTHQPIAAMAASSMYRARKFVLRHRALAASGTAVFLVLIIGIAVTTREAIVATRERDRARRAEQTVRAVDDFLQDDLLSQASAVGQAGPQSDPDPNLKVRTALDRAAIRIEGKFAAEPLVEASIRRTIGKAYLDLALYADAQKQLERTVQLRKQTLGVNDAETLAAMDELATAYAYQTKYGLAEPLLRTALDAAHRSLGPEDPTTLAITTDLGLVTASQGDYAKAATLISGALDVQRRLKGDEDSGTLVLMDDLAVEYDNMGRFADAETLRTKVVALSERVRGRDHPDTLTAINNLGVLYRKEGKYADAEQMLKTALEGRRRIYGENHHSVLTSLNSLSLLYQAEGRYAEAEPIVLQVIEAARTLLGADHADTLRYVNNLADLYRKEGKTTEAERTYASVLEARRRVLGSDHPNTVRVMTSLAEMMFERRAYGEAELLLREALHGRETKSPDSWERYYVQSLLGATIAREGRRAEAATLLASGYQGLLARESSIPAESRPLVDTVRKWNDSVTPR